MRIQSTLGLTVGPADSTHWGQVLVLPAAYGIVEVADPGGKAQQTGVRVLSRLGDALSRDVRSLRALEDLADQNFEPAIQTIILLVPVGNIVYVVLRGNGAVYVKRGSELANLMHTHGSISGEVRQGDTFLLASGGFSRVLSHDELVKLFDHLPAADIAEKLTLLLHEKSQGEGSVSLVFQISRLQEEGGAQDSQIQSPTNEAEEESAPVSPPPKSVQFRRVAHKVKYWLLALRHQPRRTMTVIAAALTVLFIVSVVLGVIKQSSVKKNQQVLAALVAAQHAFDEGVALLELNPVKGRERLVQAKEALEPLVTTVSPRTKEGRDVATLYGQIIDNLTQAMQVVESPLALYYDVSLAKKGAVASVFALMGTDLAIIDASSATAYRLDIATKNIEVLGGGETLRGATSVAIYGDKIYTLTPEGIVETRGSDKKSSVVIKRDDAWGSIVSLVAFGGNLYLLDKGKGRIWKYVATESGFSEIREYLNPDTLPDFSIATAMAIDGSVWISVTTKGVQRFTQGQENTFVPKGVEPALGTTIRIYTSDETNNVYLLDNENRRVVVLDKEGMYLSQYRFGGTQVLKDIVVSEVQHKILLLADGKIFALELK